MRVSHDWFWFYFRLVDEVARDFLANHVTMQSVPMQNESNFGNVYFVVKNTAHPSVPKTVFLLQRHIEQLIPKLPVNVFDVAFGLKNGLLCWLQITKSNFYLSQKENN